MDASLFGQGNPFGLSFPAKCPLELSERVHRLHDDRLILSLTVSEGQVFPEKSHRGTAANERFPNLAHLSNVFRDPIHGLNHNHVIKPRVLQELVNGRSVVRLAVRFVNKYPIQFDPAQLFVRERRLASHP